MRIRKIHLVLIVFFICAVSIFAIRQRAIAIRKAKWAKLEEQLSNRVAKFRGQAGIIVVDMNMNWEHSFNGNKLFPSASLVKLPIMLALFQGVQNEKITLGDRLKLKVTQKVNGSGKLKNTPAGTEFSIEELMSLMITRSDNTATNILIELLGFDYLNDYFKDFGLKNTNLSRKMMDFKARRRGIENYTSAEDIVYTLKSIYSGKFISRIISDKCIYLLKNQKVNDRIPARLPTEVVVAHKTGLERKICHDAGIVFTKKGNFIICVLTKNAASSKAAKYFISKIAQDVYNYYESL